MAPEQQQISEYLSSFPPGVFPTPEAQAQARSKIEEIESYLFTQTQSPLEWRDFFAHKTYAKILKIPAGVALTGEVYKEKCINILLKGRISILTERGFATFTAPEVMVPVEGSKKVGYAHEETLWMNVFGVPDEVYNSDKIMMEYTTKFDSKQLPLFEMKVYWEDYEDYGKFLEEYGISPLWAKQKSEYPCDQIPFPPGVDTCLVKRSELHGVGLFAARGLSAGELIAPAIIEYLRTPAGRYTNHSKNPNSHPVLHNSVIYLEALVDISNGDEITINYRDSVRVATELMRLT